MPNTKHGSRSRPPRRVRDRERRATRYVPAYGFIGRLFTAEAWNANPRRAQLSEKLCAASDCCLVMESMPEDERLPDDGVLVVGHYAADVDFKDALAEALPHLHDLMDRKFGRMGWRPVPVGLLADERSTPT